jgi:hypothetical protein
MAAPEGANSGCGEEAMRRGAKKIVEGQMRPRGLKARIPFAGFYAALKRRSSTVLHAFVRFPALSKA